MYGQLNVHKAAKTVQWRKEMVCQQMVLGQLDTHVRKKDVRLLPLGILKTSQKWIKDFNGDGKTMKLSEENIAINLHDLRLGNNFLYVTQKA